MAVLSSILLSIYNIIIRKVHFTNIKQLFVSHFIDNSQEAMQKISFMQSFGEFHLAVQFQSQVQMF